jgi:uncharacterized protein
MSNFKNDNYTFNWKDLGDVHLGRPNLGDVTSVFTYRLMQYTMRSVLVKHFGAEKAAVLFYDSGMLAGKAFCENLLDKTLPFNEFIAQLQSKLLELKVGSLRVEKSDMEKMAFVFVVTEDLDCSGLPITEETVCDYDEGFLSGLLEYYTGERFIVKEVDCWSKGDRVCRFKINVQNDK